MSELTVRVGVKNSAGVGRNGIGRNVKRGWEAGDEKTLKSRGD